MNVDQNKENTYFDIRHWKWLSALFTKFPFIMFFEQNMISSIFARDFFAWETIMCRQLCVDNRVKHSIILDFKLFLNVPLFTRIYLSKIIYNQKQMIMDDVLGQNIVILSESQ